MDCILQHVAKCGSINTLFPDSFACCVIPSSFVYLLSFSSPLLDELSMRSPKQATTFEEGVERKFKNTLTTYFSFPTFFFFFRIAFFTKEKDMDI